MENSPKISVIIPVYNVEKYLNKCVQSVIDQTYNNLEIILVDDGSPDNCPKLCDELANTDKRIRVIHKKNGGLSDARNVGIENSTGKYIMLLDSDDYINTNMVQTLYDNLIKTNSDLSISSFKSVKEGEVVDITKPTISELYTYDSTNKFEQLYSKNGIFFIIANGKLYKRKIFDKVKYPIGKINEDELTIHHILNDCNKVCFTDAKYYYYLYRENSIIHSKNTKCKKDILEGLYDRYLLFKKIYPKLEHNALYGYLSTIAIRYYYFDKTYRKIVLKSFNDEIKQNKDLIKKLSFKHKLKLFLFKYFRFIFYFLY